MNCDAAHKNGCGVHPLRCTLHNAVVVEQIKCNEGKANEKNKMVKKKKFISSLEIVGSCYCSFYLLIWCFFYLLFFLISLFSAESKQKTWSKTAPLQQSVSDFLFICCFFLYFCLFYVCFARLFKKNQKENFREFIIKKNNLKFAFAWAASRSLTCCTYPNTQFANLIKMVEKILAQMVCLFVSSRLKIHWTWQLEQNQTEIIRTQCPKTAKKWALKEPKYCWLSKCIVRTLKNCFTHPSLMDGNPTQKQNFIILWMVDIEW